MFAIQPQQTPRSKDKSTGCTPNILPCKVHYDGPIKSLNRYWTPATDENDENLQTAYFRGRKLRGRRVAIPEGYEGVIVSHSDRVMPTPQSNCDEEAEGQEPVKILEKQATFDEYVVWGHETIPAADDSFVKGVEEWVKFAEVMHSHRDQDRKPSS